MADGHEPTIAEYNQILAAARAANRAELAAAGVVRDRTWDSDATGPRLLPVTPSRQRGCASVASVPESDTQRDDHRGHVGRQRDDNGNIAGVAAAPAASSPDGLTAWARWAADRAAESEMSIFDTRPRVPRSAWSEDAIRQAERDARARADGLNPNYYECMGRPAGLGHVGTLVNRLQQQVHAAARPSVASADSEMSISNEIVISNMRPSATTARIHPMMLLELDRFGAFAPARLHAVLVALIADGRGWVDASAAADTITRKDGPWYMYGRRRLSEVLRAGENVFWTRTRGRDNRLRIWVHGRARIIAHFGLTLAGHEVTIPVAELLAGDQTHGRSREADVKATIYAAAHAGRRHAHRPIARRKLVDSLGVSKWRQRRYEHRRRIATRTHIEIDGGFSAHRLAVLQQQRIAAWRHVDRGGMFGPRGATYLAVRLPNSYMPNTNRYAPVASTRNRRRLNAQAKRINCSSTIAVWTNEAGPNDAPLTQVFYDAGEHDRAIRQASREIGRADAVPVFTIAPRRAGTRTRPRVGVWRDLSRARYSEYMAVGLS